MTNSEKSPSGIAYPDDLALLKRVYDRICQEKGIRAGSAEAEQLAARAMDLFGMGIFEEDALYKSLA
ncbi:hypothetical protein BPNPMPFG_007941 (plasmid) [Mesorhizobium sp. AR07]|uniref:hypothetical protein n=1 Tax=Mesorhizobium sp. AR07 TaxID=2865838 RepID=UPI00215F65CD|nr:hypothetical protein [Mesorhizobium sp. AR07]UVK48550.1 hypothetical protein BPNPMPFG_007941 [Mesorhizobium sp. AR07]